MRIYVLAATTALVAAPAWAADTIQTPAPVDPVPAYDAGLRGSSYVSSGGWDGFYVKGEVGYLWPELRGSNYAVTGGTSGFATTDLDDTWSAGIGAGYQINRYLRTELMYSYIFDSDFTGATYGSCGVAASCVSTDLTSWNAYSLIASVYVDLDFWSSGSAYASFVPFVGGGIGGTYVNWDTLSNTACDVTNPASCDPTTYHGGESSWRFTWELTAGLSYKFRCDFVGEAAYTYQRISEGAMFGYAASTGPGYDEGFNIQSVNLGLRYYPGRDCEPPYVPPVVPPVYK
ncbi:outer membrane protein [Hoeflea sp. TYP-13]|uniref:outer membrane protein n=1 Tax=Hoeflea sp. TYP-13 TaxID=3230023 RepID=UPI0034C625E4